MQISETDIQNTVLALFLSPGVEQGEVMWLSRLEKFWVETRLRRADLLTGVVQLCAQGLLDIEEEGSETRLSLTATGQQRAEEILRAGAGRWGQYLHKQLLPAVRVVNKPELQAGSGRRDYEADKAAEIPWSRNSS